MFYRISGVWLRIQIAQHFDNRSSALFGTVAAVVVFIVEELEQNKTVNS